jgi:hypothetical protein
MLSKTILTGLALAANTSPVRAVPTSPDDTVLSIRVADITSNDLSAYNGHPMFELYNRWLQTSPHASIVRRNASAIIDRFPIFASIECHAENTLASGRAGCKFPGTQQTSTDEPAPNMMSNAGTYTGIFTSLFPKYTIRRITGWRKMVKSTSAVLSTMSNGIGR